MIRLTVRGPAIPAASGDVAGRIRARFQAEAGALIVAAIRAHLGDSSIYSLDPGYARRKPTLRGFRRIAGKAADQPLILTAEGIYDALTITPSGDGFTVQVDDAKGISARGFDYAERMEQLTEYLEKGLADVENDLDEVLAGIIEHEMLL